MIVVVIVAVLVIVAVPVFVAVLVNRNDIVKVIDTVVDDPRALSGT